MRYRRQTGKPPTWPIGVAAARRKLAPYYAKANGLRAVRTISDEGISGSNGLNTRTGLAEVLTVVESGQVSGLVVYRLDRLARDLILQETLMVRIHEAGVEVLSVTEPDIDSEDGTRRARETDSRRG